MERLEPKKGRSPISSLKFERRSDFKKFLKFIKNETEELKGIVKPKRDKVKSILGVAGTGLGIFGIGSLLLGQTRSDEFEKGEKLDGGVDLFAAIGRRNFPGITASGESVAPRRVGRPGRTGQRIRGTRITGALTIPRSTLLQREITITRSESEITAREKREQISKNKKINKKLTKELTPKERLKLSNFDLIEQEKIVRADKGSKKVKIRRTATLEEGVGRPQSRYSTYGSRKRFAKPKTGFPRSNVKFYGNMGFQQFFGAGRIGKVRPKPGFKIDPLSGDIIPFDPIDPMEKIIQEAQADPNIRKQFLKDANLDPPSEKFNKMRRGTRTFSPFDPTKVDPERITGTLGKNKFAGKGSFAKSVRKFLRGNAKITKDSFLGISYKGPRLSFLAKAASNPAVKVVLFGLDLYNAIRSGKQIFNPKDNLAYSLYDLYVSINNKIFENDPEKLKIYRSESSDERIYMKQFQRNLNIIERRNDAARQEFMEAQGTGSNNIIVVPQNQQSNNMGGGNNLPSTTGGDEISFVPFEPLNIGDDILLHKLNQ